MATSEPSDKSSFTDQQQLTQDTHATQISMPSSSKPQQEDYNPSQEYYPEGGFGWFVLGGTFVITYWMLGMNAVWGILQEYFLANQTFPDTDSQQLTWIGSIGCASVYVAAPMVVLLNSILGTKLVLSFGLILGSIGFIGGSFATQAWHLYFSLAIPFGLGTCFLYITSCAALNQYFFKKRAFTCGIASAGSSIGGATLTPLMGYMLDRYGYRSTIRIIGGILIACVAIAIGCIRPLFSFSAPAPLRKFDLEQPPQPQPQPQPQSQQPRQQQQQQDADEIRIATPPLPLSPSPAKREAPRIHLGFSVFQSVNYTLLVIAAMLFALAYYAPIVLVPTYATSIGLTSGQAASLISVSTGTTVILRPIMGLVADRVGALNTMILSALVAGTSCLVLWMMAHSFAVLAAFMALFGGFQGVLSLLFMVAASKTVTLDRMPSAMSFVIFSTSLGYILGSPLTSVIVNHENGGNRGAAIFVGTIDFLCLALLVAIRFRTNREVFVAV
ncbi:hypothetical protein EMPS_10742 [Entomortierella parvispora]|uniref:Major facilitator superfamily (MFS) profile domain-containing protein n=1 Tax=Entomortierella parvispora TaxID=205924 RepID=A0A9P3M1K2_9FUNG|nr:hypothetical protein EMPS_10742 [Entomortierella parvispora]